MLCFELFGIRIRIDFLFVAAVTIFLLTDKTSYSIIGLLACLIHELGHMAAFCIAGARPSLLSFEMTGIRLQEPAASLPFGREVFVLSAGSFLNIAVFVIIYFYISAFYPSVLEQGVSGEIPVILLASVTHLLLGCFNLIPLKGFDGGKLLSLFLNRFMRAATVDAICRAVDIICVLLLAFVCAMLFFYSMGSLTLLIMTSYLVISSVVRIVKKD